ncbi:restriction endonuclease subunit S [Amylibacter sp.]|nr:restriction endonuclease subunit S [Amylibacter sp.]
MSEMVPEGWRISPLGAATEVVNGRAYKLTEWEDFGTPVIRLQNLTQKGGSFYFSNLELPEKQFCHKGDLLFMWSASFGPYIWWGDKAIFHYHIWKMVPDLELLNRKFLYFYLLQKTEEWKANTSGMAMQHLTKSGIEAQEVILPPLPEQKKIASILTSVDEVIETTQKKIDKLQDLKKATMNELLTKGIGHTEFKDSELGRIPKSWEVVSVLDSNISVLDGDRGNEYPKEKDFAKSGYCLFLSAKNVTKNGFRFNETAFISKDKDEKLRKGRLNRNDVIITTRGTVGNIAQYDTKIPFDVVRINSGMAIIRNQEKRLSSDFLYHILSSEIITQQIENLTFGSAQPQLTIGTLNELKIPIPQISEQLNIVHIFASILKDIQNKKQKLAQTQALKKSLMQDLLTGKVRVQVN